LIKIGAFLFYAQQRKLLTDLYPKQVGQAGKTRLKTQFTWLIGSPHFYWNFLYNSMLNE